MELPKNKLIQEAEITPTSSETEMPIKPDLLEMLLKHNKLANAGEGANGVVFKMDTTLLSDEEKEAVHETFPDLDLDEDPSKAMKLLKIFDTEKAFEEMKSQNIARQILEADDSPLKGIVSVPRANKVQEATLKDQAIIDELNSLHKMRINPDNPKANFIIMDFIEGQTLEEIESRKILSDNSEELKKYFASSDPNEIIGKLKGSELRKAVNIITGAIEGEEFIDYCKALEKLLKGKTVFSKEIQKNIGEAIKLLHSQGFYHCDLHLGNIMIGEDGIIYIIDFDRSRIIDPKNEEEVSDVYKSLGGQQKNNLSDNWIINHLKSVTQTKEDATNARKFELETYSLSGAIQKSKKTWTRFAEKNSNLDSDSVEKLANAFAAKYSMIGLGVEYSEYIVGGLISMSRLGRTEECLEYAKKYLCKQNISAREQNLLSQFIEYTSYI